MSNSIIFLEFSPNSRDVSHYVKELKVLNRLALYQTKPAERKSTLL
jgi:hypothetical protein